jgi:putative membrane protein
MNLLNSKNKPFSTPASIQIKNLQHKLEYYNYIKALHLIFVITWFAGLFYIPRLFIYHIEASEKPEPQKSILSDQLKIMTSRLWYIITWPSAVLATLFAVWLLILVPTWLQMPWMHVKLLFVVLLFAYHFKCHHIFKQMQNDKITWTSNQMRLWNEVSTLILFAVTFLVIVKDAINWIYGVIGIFLLAGMLMLGIKIYKRIRAKNPDA